jgi:hypothetical protein
MSRRSMIYVGLSVLLFASMACSVSIPAVNISTNAVRGSGKVVEETREVSGFDKVLLEGSGDLFIEQGDQEGLRIQAEDNIIPLMQIEVKNNQLRIGFKPNISVNPTQPMNFYLTVKNLTEVNLAGSGNATLKPIKTSGMALMIGGSGNITAANLTADTLKVQVFGSGNLHVDGQVKDLTVELNGSGDFDGLDLKSTTANVTSTGSGSANVNASETLNVKITGSGSVSYRGKPTVSQSIVGSGDVRSVQ